MLEIIKKLLSGDEPDVEKALNYLRKRLFPEAISLMNKGTLLREFPLYDDDPIPTNQRNLTDVRTRMGVLLEYELAKAINSLLPEGLKKDLILTYVIANRFPDLAIRTLQGDIGIRFEIKAIQTIAEEKSANFDTLLKDIRKGTDFVVVILWDWERHTKYPFKFPQIDAVYIFDAFAFAKMRDIYWLNSAPNNVGNGRQGFDLRFGINCRNGNYNKEEGNYGKLMRIFNSECEGFLPEDIRKSSTLHNYYEFCALTIGFGLKKIILGVANCFTNSGEDNCSIKLVSEVLPIIILAQKGNLTLLIVGNNNMPQKSNTIDLMKKYDASLVLCFNGKFDWCARDSDWLEIARGTKPKTAEVWASELT